MTADHGLPKVNGFLGRMRDELDNRPDIRAYLLVAACLICGIVGGWMVVKNAHMYEHPYRPGFLVLMGVVAGFLAIYLGFRAATTYKPHLVTEIPGWTGVGIGLIEVCWLAGPLIVKALNSGGGG